MVICMNNSAFIKNGILKSFLFASTLLLVTPVMGFVAQRFERQSAPN